MNKLEAAEEQLNTSIKLLFEGVSFVSCYGLAAASTRITDDLFKRDRPRFIQRQLERGVAGSAIRFSFSEELEIRIRPEFKKEGFKAFRKIENFLKHADQDPLEEIDPVNVDLASLSVFTSVLNFSLVAHRFSTPMSLFLSWFLARNPRYIKEDAPEDIQIRKIRLFREQILDLDTDESLRLMYRALQTQCPEIFSRLTSSNN